VRSTNLVLRLLLLLLTYYYNSLLIPPPFLFPILYSTYSPPKASTKRVHLYSACKLPRRLLGSLSCKLPRSDLGKNEVDYGRSFSISSIYSSVISCSSIRNEDVCRLPLLVSVHQYLLLCFV